MNKPELVDNRNISFMQDVLSWHPPLPVGSPSIDEIVDLAEEQEASAPGYAWDRMPSWVAEIAGTYNDIGDIPIIGLDVCSSNPHHTQLMRAHEFDRSGVRARAICRNIFGVEALANFKDGSEEREDFVHALLNTSSIRPLFIAALQEVLYSITSEEAEGCNEGLNEELFERLKKKFMTQNIVYEAPQGVSHLMPNEVQKDETYLELLASLPIYTQKAKAAHIRLAAQGGVKNKEDIDEARMTKPVGEVLAVEFIDWQAAQLTKGIAGNKRYRPARFFSMDLEDPASIAVSSVINTPSSIQSLDVFPQSISSLEDPRLHIQGSIFEPLPFPDDSLAIITCIDGWPFHFQLDENIHINHEDFNSVALEVLEGFYRKLAPGGKIVIFPWAINSSTHQDQKANERALRAISGEFARRIGHGVGNEQFHRQTLYNWMSTADRETAERLSPIFQSANPWFDALIVKKPNTSSSRNSSPDFVALGKEVVRALQVQD